MEKSTFPNDKPIYYQSVKVSGLKRYALDLNKSYQTTRQLRHRFYLCTTIKYPKDPEEKIKSFGDKEGLYT